MQPPPGFVPYSPTALRGPAPGADDESHLRLLSILHYVYGGLLALAAMFFSVYLIIGVAMIAAPTPGAGAKGQMLAGGVLVAFGVIIMVLVGAKASFMIWAGRSLAAHRNYTLCMVMACLACLNVPLGTALGAFTLVVLSRPTVKTLFGR
jgi:hypothetical protein